MGEVIVITSGKGGVGKTQQQRILELVCLQQEKKFL